MGQFLVGQGGMLSEKLFNGKTLNEGIIVTVKQS